MDRSDKAMSEKQIDLDAMRAMVREGYRKEVGDALIAACTEIEQLRNWVNDLQSGMFINCVYCGHRYGPSATTPSTAAEILKMHIERCPKHPMSQLKSEIEQLRKDWEERNHRVGELADEKRKVLQRRDDIITEIEQLRKERDALRDALKFYAGHNYGPTIDGEQSLGYDRGSKARAALAAQGDKPHD